MRPTKSVKGAELHECPNCGERASAPETRVCTNCGGALRNISRSRDL